MWIFGLLLLGGLSGILYQVFPQWEVRKTISTENIAPETEPPNHLFIAPLEIRFSDNPETGWRSKVRLFENGIALGPSSAGHPQMRDIGGGGFRHWEGTLCFSSSDGSDPRYNGLRYDVHYPWLFPKWAVATFSLLASVSSLGLIGLFLLKAARKLKKSLPSTHKSELIHTCAQIALAGVVGVLWLAFVPPVFTGDSGVLAVFDLRFGTLPHYPILYPLFTRGILFNASEFFQPHIVQYQQWFDGALTDEGIYIIVASQMLLWTIAVLYFVFSLKLLASTRWLALLVFLFCFPIYYTVLSIMSESVWVSILLFQVTLAIQLFNNPGWTAGYVWYSLLVALSMLTRHAGLFLAGLLPLAFLMLLVLRLRDKLFFKYFILSLVSIFAAIGLSKGLTSLVYNGLDIQNHSIFGRAAIYHLSKYHLNELSKDAISEIKDQLLQRANTDAEKKIVEVVLPAEDPWYGSYLKAHAILSQSQHIPEGTTPEVDALLNRIMINYFAMFHPVHRMTIANAMRSYLLDAFRLNLFIAFVKPSIYYSDFKSADNFSEFLANMDNFTIYQNEANRKILFQSIGSFISGAYLWGYFFSIFLVLTVVLLSRRKITYESAIFNFCCVITIIFYLLAISIVTVYVGRYAISCLLFSMCCLCLIISQLQTKNIIKK